MLSWLLPKPIPSLGHTGYRYLDQLQELLGTAPPPLLPSLLNIDPQSDHKVEGVGELVAVVPGIEHPLLGVVVNLGGIGILIEEG